MAGQFKDPIVQAPETLTLTTDQFQAAIAAAIAAAGKPNLEDQMSLIRLQAEENAKANRKLLRPENATHPGISVYSRPGGEVANPKAPFGYTKVKWGGTDMFWETTKASEVDLLNELVPGAYSCTRSDGIKFPVKVVPTVDDVTGERSLLDVQFDAKAHGKILLSLEIMCRDMLEQARMRTARASAKVA